MPSVAADDAAVSPEVGVGAAAPRSTRIYIFALTALVVVLNVAGNLFLSWGMKHVSLTVGVQPLDYIRVMLSPFVATGVALLIFWLLTRMVLLSRSDLSYVLPATASGYVLNAILALFILKESLDKYQWAGTLLICLGAALVGSDLKDEVVPEPPPAAR